MCPHDGHSGLVGTVLKFSPQLQHLKSHNILPRYTLMSPDNQKKLEESFPGIFTKVSPPLTPFDQRGIECGDGWFDLVECLSQTLTQHKTFHPKENQFRVSQIKEKFGSLRFHLSGPCSEEVLGVLDFATNMSARICEQCGHPGNTRHDQSWVRTLCDSHAGQ